MIITLKMKIYLISILKREKCKRNQQYQQYQESQQNQQPWSDSSDIRIVDSDELPDPHPITDTDVCSKCGNNQARWWIVTKPTLPMNQAHNFSGVQNAIIHGEPQDRLDIYSSIFFIIVIFIVANIIFFTI